MLFIDYSNLITYEFECIGMNDYYLSQGEFEILSGEENEKK